MNNQNIPDAPGIYVVALNNKKPISINADDPRHADTAYKANYKNVKTGKAKSLKGRMDNYFKTFGEDNVNFEPIIITEEIKESEKTIKNALDPYRVSNPKSGRKTEWMIGITKEQTIKIIKDELLQSDIAYTLL